MNIAFGFEGVLFEKDNMKNIFSIMILRLEKRMKDSSYKVYLIIDGNWDSRKVFGILYELLEMRYSLEFLFEMITVIEFDLKVVMKIGFEKLYLGDLEMMRDLWENIKVKLWVVYIFGNIKLVMLLSKINESLLYDKIVYNKLSLMKKIGIKVCSYNMSIDAFLGADSRWVLGSKCKKNGEKYVDKKCEGIGKSKCFENSMRILVSGGYDVICLQEVACLKDVMGFEGIGEKYGEISVWSGSEYVVTLYDKVKFRVLKTVVGEFVPGRVVLMMFFSGGLVVINVHVGYGGEIRKIWGLFDDKIMEELGRGWNVLICGDSNFQGMNGRRRLGVGFWKGKKRLRGREFWSANLSGEEVGSCCSRDLRGIGHAVGIDVIFFSNGLGGFRVRWGLFVPSGKYALTSDHLPVVAKFRCWCFENNVGNI